MLSEEPDASGVTHHVWWLLSGLLWVPLGESWEFFACDVSMISAGSRQAFGNYFGVFSMSSRVLGGPVAIWGPRLAQVGD
eukprot:8417027-Karenia_brevis.AAC.1